MRSWPRGLLQAIAIAILALILINAAVLAFPASERAATLAIVIAGTVMLATLRWGLWPFHRRRAVAEQDGGTQLHEPSQPNNRRRLQLKIVAGLLVVLSFAWIVAALAWTSYEDAVSRLLVLRGLARTSAVVISAAILVMPPLRKGFRQSGYQLMLVVLLAFGWFAGTICLPWICDVLGNSCYDIEKFVLAIPGWSFVPVAALLLRSIGARLGIASWRSFDWE